MSVLTGIRSRLLLLAAICTLPVFALLIYDAWHSSRQEIADTRAELKVRVAAAAADLDRNIRSARLLLRSMSQIPAIAAVGSAQCPEQLAVLAAPYAQIGTASVIATDGTFACTIEPGTTAVNVADRDYFRKALHSQDSVIGKTVTSRRYSGTYVLPVAMALRDATGHETGVIVVGINLDQFAKDNAATWTDAGTIVTLWDQEPRILFRWPDAQAWIGKGLAETALDEAAGPDAAVSPGDVGADSATRVRAIAAVGATGLRLTQSAPRDVLLAPHTDALIRNIAWLTLITLAGFAVAWRFGEVVIRRPLTSLAGAAERMRSGSLDARSALPHSRDELGVVARSFDAMAEGLEAQIAALRESEDRLRDNLRRTESAEQRVRQQLEHMNLLDQVTRSIGERLDLQSIFQVVVRTIEDSLPVDFCCIALHDPQADALRVERIGVKSESLAQQMALEERTPFGVDNNGLARCMGGQLVHEPDIANVRFPFPERLARGGLRALVLAPLRSESKVFGVLVAARRDANSFTSIECEFLRQLSEHVALGAGQAQLHGALRQAYEDLRQTQQVVMQEERLRALGQMASGIAHDINNALSPVSLYTESLLATEAGLSDRARGYLETIQRSVDDVAATVARMREFYRHREVQIELAPVAVNRVVQQVVDLTRARWSDMSLQQGIVIHTVTDLPADVPDIMGVDSEIREALTNLVLNAVDAMPEGGTLTLRTRMAGAGAQDTSVVIEVCDEGFGMDEETRRRCLEPFFTTKGERGTGLGLAMVFGTMQRHSADLEIDSVPGRGTTVRLVFAVPAELATEAEPRASAGHAPSRLRLLVIDDDPVLLKSLRDALEADGHSVVTANGGIEGIGRFRASVDAGDAFAAVITDLGMPYVDGRKVAAAIKEASSATPVILLTGWGQRLVADGDTPPFVDRVLSKPPRLREIREALACLCRPAG
jgi:signal transduction histidine kinase/ActR/RegA family two-component response regulator/HAMP domain-containing protein